MPPELLPITALIVLALLPVMFSWLVVVIPSRRREASGLVVGNPLDNAPLAPAAEIVPRPLIAMSRHLSHADMADFVPGMRHLPLEQVAPLLTRYVRCPDPALQLYAQSLLSQGRDHLHHQFVALHEPAKTDARSASWMLEIGLRLASPTLIGPSERGGFLLTLAAQAADALKTCEHTPGLLANAVRSFLAASRITDARNSLNELPERSPLRLELEPAVAHALHQERLA